ncbi:MAG: hypothetical protein GY859_02740 [Desulfobacterales bacterium]|nr:hypothetical protein [Desulfobacterales bacterium]
MLWERSLVRGRIEIDLQEPETGENRSGRLRHPASASVGGASQPGAFQSGAFQSGARPGLVKFYTRKSISGYSRDVKPRVNSSRGKGSSGLIHGTPGEKGPARGRARAGVMGRGPFFRPDPFPWVRWRFSAQTERRPGPSIKGRAGSS